MFKKHWTELHKNLKVNIQNAELSIKKLLNQGLKIDRIGLQCHICDDGYYKNIFNSERLYNLLDTYGSFGKPLVLSEIGLSCEDEEIQALAAERIYAAL